MQQMMTEIGGRLQMLLVGRHRRERGASLVEYALLLVLIAMACLAAITFLGGDTSTGLSTSASRIGNA